MKSRTTRVLAATVVVLTVVVVGQFTHAQTRPEPVDALDYPVQRVLNTVAGSNRPTVLFGQDVTVRGTKCNTTPDPVAVSGVTSWVSVDPPGTVIEVGRGNTTRAPGCVTRVFSDPVPAGVLARTAAVVAHSAAPCMTWTITGREAPSDPLIEPEVWTSEPFDVCPPTRPATAP